MKLTRKCRTVFLIVAAMLLLISGRPGEGAPPDNKCLDEFSSWGVGATSAFTEAGEFLIYNRGAALEIATVDQSGAVDVVGRVEMPEPIRGLAVKENTLFAAAGESGLRVIDIETPSAPTEIGFHDTPGDAWAVAVHDDLVVVADNTGGLRAFTIDDPSSVAEAYVFEETRIVDVVANDRQVYAIDGQRKLRVFGRSGYYRLHPITSLEIERYASHLALVGDHLYYSGVGRHTSWDGLYVVDVSKPMRPEPMGHLSFQNPVIAMAVDGNIALTAEGGEGRPQGVRLIDVSDPSEPEMIRFFRTDYPWAVFASSDRAYVGDLSGWLQILSIESPSEPFELNRVRTGDRIQSVAKHGSYLYVVDRYLGFWILDMSRPKTPRQIGFVPTSANPTDISVESDLAIISSSDGFTVFDVSDPAAPERVAFVPRTMSMYSDYLEVELTSGYAYVAEPGPGGGLRVLDVSVPSNTHEVAFLGGMPNGAWSIELEGDIAYVLGLHEGIHVIDIEHPETPSELAFIPATPYGGVFTFAVDGDLAYIASRYRPSLGGVIDVSNPRSPVEVGIVDWVGDHFASAMSGDALYIVDGTGSIRVISLRYPSAPREVQQIESAETSDSMTFIKNRLYYYEPRSRLRMFRQCLRPDTPHPPSDISMSAD